MIVVEDILNNLINSFPELVINDNNTRKPFFGDGTKEELNRNLEEYGSNVYPLIWLLPSSTTYNTKSKQADKDCKFIIATIEADKDLLNEDRRKYSLKTVLNPLFERLIEAFEKTSNIDITNYDIVKDDFLNYSEDGGTIDLWDAVKVDISLRFNNNCPNVIKWRNENT